AHWSARPVVVVVMSSPLVVVARGGVGWVVGCRLGGLVAGRRWAPASAGSRGPLRVRVDQGLDVLAAEPPQARWQGDRLNAALARPAADRLWIEPELLSHLSSGEERRSYAVFCLKKKNTHSRTA